MAPVQIASKVRLERLYALTIPVELLLQSRHEALVFRYGSNGAAAAKKQIQPLLKLADFMLQDKQIAQIQFVEATEDEIRRVSVHEGSQAMICWKLIGGLRDGLPRKWVHLHTRTNEAELVASSTMLSLGVWVRFPPPNLFLPN